MEKINVIVLVGLAAIVVFLTFIIFRMFSREKLRVKFHQAIYCGSYHDLLYFLIFGLKNDSIKKKILGKSIHHYDEYLRQGFNRYFDDLLNVRVTSSRVSRIQKSFEDGKQTFDKLESELNYSRDNFWKPIESELKKVIYACGPNYFYSCYVNSLLDLEKEEKGARSFLLDYYNKCANSNNEKERAQFYLFVELFNKEIDKNQEYSTIPKEKKDFLLSKKLKIEENISTVKNIYAH